MAYISLNFSLIEKLCVKVYFRVGHLQCLAVSVGLSFELACEHLQATV